jgi:hypothetical protein
MTRKRNKREREREEVESNKEMLIIGLNYQNDKGQ